MSVAAMSKVYRVAKRTIYDLLARERKSGSMQTYSGRSGRKPAIDADGLERMREIILERPDIALSEIKDEMQVDICLSAVHRIISQQTGVHI
jgi:transposase